MLNMNLQFFGGRGGSSGKSSTANYTGSYKITSIYGASDLYFNNVSNYTVDYEPYARGQISKIDAGQVYKASKNGDINVLPEYVSMMYDSTSESIRFASSRYNQESMFYDSVQRTTHALLNNDYKAAQKLVDGITNDLIKRSGKKSRFNKYINEIENK